MYRSALLLSLIILTLLTDISGQTGRISGKLIKSSDTTQLSTVKIVGRIPPFRNRSDGTTEVNVAGSVLSASSSVTEILGRTPGVTVSEEGISVLGKGEAILYLNGRRATAQQIASLPVNQISKIEVVSNPSAKYDAEGNAIINVITFSPAGEGYNINLRSQLSLSDFTTPITASNADANYKKGNFEFRAGYGLSLGTNREILNTTRTRSNTGDHFRSELMTDWKRKQLNFSNFTAGMQYALNSKSYLSAEYIGSSNHLGGATNNTNQISSTTLQGSFSSKIDPDLHTSNHSVSANYHLNMDTLGSELLFGAQLASYRSVNDDMITEYSQTSSGASTGLIHNDAFQKIDLSIIQADLTRMISRSHKIELGAKFGIATTGSGTDFYNSLQGPEFPLVPDVTNRFTYDENIAAVYGNLLGSIGKKLSYGFGLRIERTGYHLSTGADPIIRKNYIDLFPNAFLSYRVSEKIQLRASYANRIARPRYQALNPSVIYQDAFTSIVGNPLLRPENIHALELGANYRSYALKVGYNYVIDPISAAALQSGQPNSYVLKSLNFLTLNTWFISFTAPVNISIWNSVNTVSLTKNTYRADELDFVMNKSTPQLYLYSSNTFRVGNLFKFQLLGWYQSKRNLGTSFNKDRALLALGLEKEFLKGSLKVNLLANDLLFTDKPEGSYTVGGTFVAYARKNNTRYYRATLSYSFGGLKKSTFKNTSVGQAENGRAL